MIGELEVKKRSGSVVPFDKFKINRAITNAFIDYLNVDSRYTDIDNYQKIIDMLTDSVANIWYGKKPVEPIDIEKIQDTVELQLMSQGYYEVARLYIRYRQDRKNIRTNRLKPDNTAIVGFVHMNKYARYVPEIKRREVFSENIERVRKMHLEKYPQITEKINWAFDRVLRGLVLPSMRSMQYAGSAIKQHNAKIYNCSASYCNRLKFFQETFYLLLCGVGVGYSVQEHHVEQLPALINNINEDNVVHHTIKDSIEGWADALGALLKSYTRGYLIEFNYSEVREKGSKLKTSGGKAPGHVPLKKALEKIRSILNGALGRKLRPIECHDIICYASDAVMSGGNRESAMIAIFSIDDLEMMNCKTGDWWKTNPQRARANNSALVLRNNTNWNQFKKLFGRTKQFGEPGIIFADTDETLYNPCSEIGLRGIYIVADEDDAKRLAKLYDIKVKPGDIYYGSQMCNLTEINGSLLKTYADFEEAVEAAAIIGTCQAGFTDFEYLGWVTQEITRREALLGVSITGMMDSPEVCFNPEFQRNAAKHAIKINSEIASKIGINSAARVTCVKPSGSTSIIFGGTAAGIHPRHARRFFRRVKANKMSAVYQYFKSINPHMIEPYKDDSDYIVMCIESPEKAIVRDDLSAIQFLDKVKLTQQNWVMTGTAKPESSPGICHNVSNTITVKDDEWDDVAKYLWTNRESFSGISMLPYVGDKIYRQPPFESVTSPEDEAKWNTICSMYKPVDYSLMQEDDDNTDLAGELACYRGVCQI